MNTAPLTTTLTSREFNQDTARAKRAAQLNPVVITDRGRPAFVLLHIDAFRKLEEKNASVAELLSMPKDEPYFDFEPPRLSDKMFKPVDFS
jgi:prevent-host-death family protein